LVGTHVPLTSNPALCKHKFVFADSINPLAFTRVAEVARVTVKSPLAVGISE